MKQVRCTNCGSTAIVADESGLFCKCEACGSTFNVPKAEAFSQVKLDHTQDVRAWREYLGKQLKLQMNSNKSRDYGGVKLFAQKILSVLPDDFCATYYLALAERYEDNDTAFVQFLHNADFSQVTPEEKKEVVDNAVATVEPKYDDMVKEFAKRAYPEQAEAFDAVVERNLNNYVQKLKLAKVAERDVFICHRTAEPDQDIADAICSRLEDRGLRCWIAPRNILAGSQNYERDIINGVENCKIFLFVSSYKSMYSSDCEMELKTAVLANKALYSYKIDDTAYDGAFERALAKVQWLDATDDPYAHLEQLVIDIKGMLAEDAREKAELNERRLEVRERERAELEEQRAKERERIERLEKLITGESVATVAPSANVKSRLKRAEIEVGSGNFEKAEEIIDKVLNIVPESSLAWWILLLCSYHVKNDEELLNVGADFTANSSYTNAERFADDAMKARIDKVATAYQVNVIKSVSKILDGAETAFEEEDFTKLRALLGRCANAFKDENGLLFRKFPDIASKYFWLKLWARYGQTPLVCVEDITRETEYQNAMRYGSPAQVAEYDKAKQIISKNAEMFLKERSKNRANDGKLSDYLVDNKNILDPETYNNYSSLFYFRKMLKELNMSEGQLKSSTADISTNEYFMLAQAIATDKQKEEYDALVKSLDDNRAKKEKEAGERKEKERAESLQKKREKNLACILCTVLSIVSVIVAAVCIYVAFSSRIYDSNGEPVLAIATIDKVINVLIGCNVVHALVQFVINIYIKDDKRLVKLSVINLISSLAILVAIALASFSLYGWVFYNAEFDLFEVFDTNTVFLNGAFCILCAYLAGRSLKKNKQ